MRPLPNTFLVLIIVALCGLCSYQWWRESALRELGVSLRDEAGRRAAQNLELEDRVKAADAEILRLTASVGELRTTSVSKQSFDELTLMNAQLREIADKQNVAIQQQNEAIERQNTAIQTANENIKKLTEERDGLLKKLNDTTAAYNKLAQAPRPAPSS